MVRCVIVSSFKESFEFGYGVELCFLDLFGTKQCALLCRCPNCNESFELGYGAELCLCDLRFQTKKHVPRCVDVPSSKGSFEFGYGVELGFLDLFRTKKMCLVV